MLIEQAFHALPEILAGSGYPIYKYEASVVGAFSMALLQEFNARNVDFPVQHLHFEKRYVDGLAVRCDLQVSYTALQTVYKHALEAYGQRETNWLEAKLFKPQDKNLLSSKGLGEIGTGNRTTQRNDLLEDLLRLCLLADDTAGRYLLHIYLARPDDCLAIPKRDDDETRIRKAKYEWARKLTSNIGVHTLTVDHKAGLGALGCTEGLVADVKITNYRLRPTSMKPDDAKYFWMVLTRIESCEWTDSKQWSPTEHQKNKLCFRDVLAGNTNGCSFPSDTLIF